ncbi:TonB-dependent receptor [Rheinheimera pacifica]|uniref:TonB-dependent receptor n=1 Tax=Rheinheimera pacifica TaxID=173990 RepID=UPI002ED9333B
MAGLVPVQPVFYLVLLLLFSPAVWPAAQHNPEPQHKAADRQRYALPAQPLAAALLQFARQINKPLLFNPAQLAGLQASAVAGDFTADEVLQQLLAQQPLEAIPHASGWLIKAKVLVVKPAAAPAKPAAKPTASAPAMEIIAVRANGGVHRQNGATTLLPTAETLKRQAMIAQDSLVAEDITDFPALNVANAISRVPGISITREWGEGRQISLRGLGPDFTRVQVNGMETLGTSSSPMDARGALSRSRAFDFNIFAAELFNQIDVKKSYSAEQEEGGIAGTVNLRTAKPFDYAADKASISAQLGSNSNANSKLSRADPRFSALVSKRWSDLGALISLTYSSRATNEYGSNTTRWRRESGKQAADPNNSALQSLLDSGDLWFPRGQRLSVWENQQQRLGITAALQYQPVAQLNLLLDVMHGKLENQLSEHHHAVKDNNLVQNLIWRDSKGGNTGDKEVVYASYKNASWRNENRQDYNESVFSQISLSADWALSHNLQLRAMLGHSSSDYRQPLLSKLNIEAKQQADIVTDFTRDAFYGRSYSSNFDVTALVGYTVRDLFFQSNFTYSDFDNARLDFTWQLSNNRALSFGLHHKTFNNSGFQQEASGFPHSSATPLNQGMVSLKADQVQLYSGHPDQSWLQGNIAALQAFYGLNGFALTDADTIASSVYRLTEQTNAGYLQYQQEFAVAGAPLRASLGLRYFRTQLASQTPPQVLANSGPASNEPTNVTRYYSGYLPGLDISYEFADDMLWRLGLSKNITRPSLSDLALFTNVTKTSLGETDIGQINTGNPQLKPFSANNLDTALEWYFADGGLFSAALFYKDIKHFIAIETQPVIYRELGLPASLLPEGKTVDDVFNLSSPQNGGPSSIKGVELALQRKLDFLPAPFNQFGIAANYTWADGNTLYRNVQNSGEDQRKAFTGLSRHSYNLALYYDTPRWGARLTTVYRSRYIAAVESGSIDDDERGYHASTNVDFSAFYRLNDYIKLNIEALNLTNLREELYSDSSDRAYNSTYSGRTYMLGVTAEF